MKKKCIVHIGMHKTGSSSIQTMLYSHLTDNNFHYTDLETPNQSGVLNSLFSDCPEELLAHRELGRNSIEVRQYNERKRTLLLNGLAEARDATVIYSGEGISKMKRDTELPRFKKFLDEHFNEVSIVAYIRPPWSYTESWFYQGISSGRRDKFNLDNRFPKYKKWLEKFDQLFGRENVSFWKYDTQSFPNNDVVQDFCDRLGIINDGYSTKKMNRSLSLAAISLLFVYRKYGEKLAPRIGLMKENQKMLKFLEQIKGDELQFSYALINLVIAKYVDEIEWMESRLGESLLETRQDNNSNINSENDLLLISIESAQQLIELMNKQFGLLKIIDQKIVKSPRDVADIMHILRLQFVENK